MNHWIRRLHVIAIYLWLICTVALVLFCLTQTPPWR